MSVVPSNSSDHPHEEAGHRTGSHHHEPEPEEEVDLLSVQVDGQYTLYSVPLYIPQHPNEEVTHGHAGEDRRVGKVVVILNLTNEVDAKCIVVRVEEVIEEEELADDIGNIEKLDKEEQEHQIAAQPPAYPFTAQEI